MSLQTIHYDVIGKAVVHQGGGHESYALKLLYKGDSTPWWTCASGLELPVSKEVYDAAVPNSGKVTITISVLKSDRA